MASIQKWRCSLIEQTVAEYIVLQAFENFSFSMLLWHPSTTCLGKNFQANYFFRCLRKQAKFVHKRSFVFASLLRVFVGNPLNGSTTLGTPFANIQIGDVLNLDEEETQHLRARRVKENEALEVFDGSGYVGRAIFLGFSKANKRSSKILIQSWEPVETKDSVKLTIGVGIPQGKRGDWLIEKLTELGVDAVIPVLYERTSYESSVIDQGRKQRWQRICISACKQCCRNHLMEIHQEQFFRDVMSKQKYTKHWDKVYMASIEADCPSMVPQITSSTRVLGIVGPEGGLTKGEENIVLDFGAHCLKLSRYVLRVETAATVLASLLFLLHSDSTPEMEES